MSWQHWNRGTLLRSGDVGLPSRGCVSFHEKVIGDGTAGRRFQFRLSRVRPQCGEKQRCMIDCIWSNFLVCYDIIHNKLDSKKSDEHTCRKFCDLARKNVVFHQNSNFSYLFTVFTFLTSKPLEEVINKPSSVEEDLFRRLYK